jgi:hypothetical protein
VKKHKPTREGLTTSLTSTVGGTHLLYYPLHTNNFYYTVPVVCTAQDVMVLIGEILFEGNWKGWALKIETCLGPKASASGAQKNRNDIKSSA